MNEKPIIFSSEMVRAILEGRKSQTRRVIKPQPKLDIGMCDPFLPALIDGKYVACPYGQPGDHLWVRETWGVHQLDGISGKEYPNILYKADDSTRLVISDEVWKYNKEKFQWRPSIHMPCWASRITLEIVDVRVERVQDISDSDIMDEGTKNCEYALPPYCTHCGGHEHLCNRDRFRELWNSINAKRGYPWASNPWVWVVEFRRVEPKPEERG